MTLKLLILSLVIGFNFGPISSFTYEPSKLNYECDNIPELNKKIIEFVSSKINRRVGRGYCWDLAAVPLNLIDANWDGKRKFGRKVDYKEECIFPGDIIQLKGIRLKYRDNKGVRYTEIMRNHTAIIYEVKGRHGFVLAHQNTQGGKPSGKKVSLGKFEFKNITKGKFIIYRPVY